MSINVEGWAVLDMNKKEMNEVMPANRYEWNKLTFLPSSHNWDKGRKKI